MIKDPPIPVTKTKLGVFFPLRSPRIQTHVKDPEISQDVTKNSI